METIRTSTTYFIPPGKFLLMENALGNPDLIQSSVSSDCRVTIVDTANFPLDELEQWPTFRLTSSDVKLKLGEGLYYVYIVVPTPDNAETTTAFISYNTVLVDRKGYDADGKLLGKEKFCYYQCGTVSARGGNPSVVTTPSGQGRVIEMDLGVTPAPSTLPGDLNDFDKMFQLDKVDPNNPKSWLLTILATVKSMTARLVRITGSLVFGSGESEKVVTDVALSGQSADANSVSDSILPTTAWVYARFLVLDDRFLRKDQDDHTSHSLSVGKNLSVGKKITSHDGLSTDDFLEGASGASVYQNKDGQWCIETDNVKARRKFSANDVEIQSTDHIGGQAILTAARMRIDYVLEESEYYRCYFRKSDGEGNVIRNEWKPSDLAYCNTFNLERQSDGSIGNHYYWREVVAVSSEANQDTESERTFGDETIRTADYHFVDLSKLEYAEGSNAPKSGDKVVQLGYSKDDDSGRQSAIVIAGAGTGSPYIQIFEGIHDFSLPSNPDQLKPGDNRLSGRLTIKEGSTGWRNLEGLPDSIQEALTMSEEAKKFVESQEYGKNNLLRNSGFTGDYVTASLQDGDVLTGGSDMFSPSLVHWIYDGATPMESDVSESGKEVMLISGGSLRQRIVNKVMVGESYVFSFRGRGIGSVTFSFGGYTKNIAFNSEDWELYVEKFVATADNQRFAIEAYEDCFLCELQLERGTLRSAWGISPLDNRSELAKYESLRYMSDAIEKGSTDVLGGLILTNMMLMRNLENKVTSGSSGVYSDDNSVAYFAGGDMEAAVRTAMAYMDDPTYQPTQEELNNMAKYVVTHGGRAILNDVILRGYIYALGGKFKGEIEATSGIFKNVTSPNSRFSIDENGFVRVAGGRIGGFSVNGNRLSNQDEQGNYLTDAVVSSRNFNSVNETDRLAEIGADVFSGVNGVSCVGRFENNDQNRQAGTNYGIMVGAYNAKNNAAISMEGGYIQGFALKTTILNSYATSYSINKKDANILCWNNNNLTIYLPSMSSFDDGHFIRIKRLGSSITLRTMDCETIKADGSIRTSKPVFVSGDTSVSVIDTNGLSLGGQLGAVLELVWVRDIEHNVNGTTYYGAWVVINKL